MDKKCVVCTTTVQGEATSLASSRHIFCSTACQAQWAEHTCGCGDQRELDDMIVMKQVRYCMGKTGCLSWPCFPHCSICLGNDAFPGFFFHEEISMCIDCVETLMKRRHRKICCIARECFCSELVNTEEQKKWLVTYHCRFTIAFSALYRQKLTFLTVDLLPLLLSYLC